MSAIESLKREFPNALFIDAHLHPGSDGEVPTRDGVSLMLKRLSKAGLDGAIMLMHSDDLVKDYAIINGLLKPYKSLIPGVELNESIKYYNEGLKAHMIYLKEGRGFTVIPAHPFKNHGMIRSAYSRETHAGRNNRWEVPTWFTLKFLKELRIDLYNPCNPLQCDIEALLDLGIRFLVGSDAHPETYHKIGNCGAIINDVEPDYTKESLLNKLINESHDCFFYDKDWFVTRDGCVDYLSKENY